MKLVPMDWYPGTVSVSSRGSHDSSRSPSPEDPDGNVPVRLPRRAKAARPGDRRPPPDGRHPNRRDRPPDRRQ